MSYIPEVQLAYTGLNSTIDYYNYYNIILHDRVIFTLYVHDDY